MSEDWKTATNVCPKCGVAHAKTPFCPLCGYEYKSKVFAETADVIIRATEDESEAFMKEARRPGEFFRANPERDFYLRIAGPATCTRWNTRRPPDQRMDARPGMLLFVCAHAVDHAELEYRALTAPLPLDGLPPPPDEVAPEDVARRVWENLQPSARQLVDLMRTTESKNV